MPFAQKDVKKKFEIGNQAPKWVFEGRGLVFLEEKMAKPSKPVTDYRDQDPHPLMSG